MPELEPFEDTKVFRAQSKRLGPVWSLFPNCLATKNDLNGPKSGTVGQSLTILYKWGPLGAILGYFGPYWSDFRAHSAGALGPVLSLFKAYFSQDWLPKMT